MRVNLSRIESSHSPRNFHATILDVFRNGSAPPVRVLGGVRMRLSPRRSPAAAAAILPPRTFEVRHGAAVELHRPARARIQQRPSTILELVAQVSDETQGVGSQDLGRRGADGRVDLDVDGGGSGFHGDNCTSFLSPDVSMEYL